MGTLMVSVILAMSFLGTILNLYLAWKIKSRFAWLRYARAAACIITLYSVAVYGMLYDSISSMPYLMHGIFVLFLSIVVAEGLVSAAGRVEDD